MPKGVKCSVSNCSFWEENNNCGASAIQIEIDAHADGTTNGSFDSEFSTELSESHQDTAKDSAATCCLTFTPSSNCDEQK